MGFSWPAPYYRRQPIRARAITCPPESFSASLFFFSRQLTFSPLHHNRDLQSQLEALCRLTIKTPLVLFFFFLSSSFILIRFRLSYLLHTLPSLLAPCLSSTQPRSMRTPVVRTQCSPVFHICRCSANANSLLVLGYDALLSPQFLQTEIPAVSHSGHQYPTREDCMQTKSMA